MVEHSPEAVFVSSVPGSDERNSKVFRTEKAACDPLDVAWANSLGFLELLGKCLCAREKSPESNAPTKIPGIVGCETLSLDVLEEQMFNNAFRWGLSGKGGQNPEALEYRINQALGFYREIDMESARLCVAIKTYSKRIAESLFILHRLPKWGA